MKKMILILAVTLGSLLFQSCFYGHYIVEPPHRHYPVYVAPGPPPPPPIHRPHRR